MKQHDRVSTASQGSRQAARDPQEHDIALPKRVRAFHVGNRTIPVPDHGEITLTFHDGQLRYIDRHTKEKVE